MLNGPKNGLRAKAIRDNNDWFFVAGVWDFNADTYTLYWRQRSVSADIRSDHSAPEDALWIGAKNDRLGTPAEGVEIDELRIIGRALSEDEIKALREGKEG